MRSHCLQSHSLISKSKPFNFPRKGYLKWSNGVQGRQVVNECAPSDPTNLLAPLRLQRPRVLWFLPHGFPDVHPPCTRCCGPARGAGSAQAQVLGSMALLRPLSTSSGPSLDAPLVPLPLGGIPAYLLCGTLGGRPHRLPDSPNAFPSRPLEKSRKATVAAQALFPL